MADLNDIYLKACDYIDEITSKIPTFPLTDVYEDLDSKITYVEIALPGYKKENITILNEGNQLIIEAKAEPLKGNIKLQYENIVRKDTKRILTFTKRYLGGEISAAYVDGLLKLTLKQAPEFSNKIEIQNPVAP